MKYKAVLFDMDGTVLDTLDDLTDAVNASFRHFDLPVVERGLVSSSLGNGAAYLIRHCLPETVSDEESDAVLSWYKDYYDAHCRIKTSPYPGIPELMQALHRQRIKLAIISNKPDPAVQELAAQFFPGLMDVVVGESAAVRRKPSPDSVLTAAGAMEVPVGQCVYIGDTEVDIQTAKNAGMDCITVSWGFRSRKELLKAGASIIADTPEELGVLLC